MDGDAWLFSATSGGVVSIQDGKVSGTVAPSPDVSQFQDVTGQLSGGKTIVNCKRALDTNDADDVAISAGSSYQGE